MKFLKKIFDAINERLNPETKPITQQDIKISGLLTDMKKFEQSIKQSNSEQLMLVVKQIYESNLRLEDRANKQDKNLVRLTATFSELTESIADMLKNFNDIVENLKASEDMFIEEYDDQDGEAIDEDESGSIKSNKRKLGIN
jgi:uncharacterized coiled-coil protein SlyX